MSDISTKISLEGRVLLDDGTNVNWAQLLQNISKGKGEIAPSNYLYVAKSGNDTTGDGSANLPYLTIAKAISAASSGTTIFVFPGTYTESITLVAGVNLTCPVEYGVYIIGNHTANFSGTVVCENIVLQNASSAASGTVLTFSGTGAQNLIFLNSYINSASLSGAGDAISWTNTNASSKIQHIDGNINVAHSNSTARAIVCASTAAGSFIANRCTVKIDSPDNVAIVLAGSVSYTHTADAITGQVTVANTASAAIAQVAMATTSVAVLTTSSSGTVALINDTISTTATPAIAGAGILTDVALLYLSTGVGGASTLNGGLGPISLPMSSVKIRSATLVPAGQVAAGSNTGAFEFDGTHLYFTIGTTRSTIV
jgi:hypothetical protein